MKDRRKEARKEGRNKRRNEEAKERKRVAKKEVIKEGENTLLRRTDTILCLWYENEQKDFFDMNHSAF